MYYTSIEGNFEVDMNVDGEYVTTFPAYRITYYFGEVLGDGRLEIECGRNIINIWLNDMIEIIIDKISY